MRYLALLAVCVLCMSAADAPAIDGYNLLRLGESRDSADFSQLEHGDFFDLDMGRVETCVGPMQKLKNRMMETVPKPGPPLFAPSLLLFYRDKLVAIVLNNPTFGSRAGGGYADLQEWRELAAWSYEDEFKDLEHAGSGTLADGKLLTPDGPFWENWRDKKGNNLYLYWAGQDTGIVVCTDEGGAVVKAMAGLLP